MPRDKLPLVKLLPNLPAEVQEKIAALGLPEDAPALRKQAASVPEEVAEGERAVIGYVSTRDIDRDHEILVPEGAILDEFLLAPQVLWGHNYAEPPIGSDEWIRSDGYGLKAKTRYATTERAEEIFTLKREGHLRTSSVGFVPIEFVDKDGAGWAEVVKRLGKKWGVGEEHFAEVKRIFTKWLLLEHSDVSVPANPHALTLAVAKGLGLGDGIIKELGIKVEPAEPPAPTLTMPEPEGEPWPYQRPYPNEHSCRIRSPDDFQPDSFRRVSRDHEGKTYYIIMGRLQGETTMTEQAYRYPKDEWAETAAKKHCKAHDGISFEAATGRSIRRVVIAKRTPVVRRLPQVTVITPAADLESLVQEEIEKAKGKV